MRWMRSWARGLCSRREARLEEGGREEKEGDSVWSQAVPEVMNEAIMKYLCFSASATGWRITTDLAQQQGPLNHARGTHTQNKVWMKHTHTHVLYKFCDKLLPWKVHAHIFTRLLMTDDRSLPTTHCVWHTHQHFYLLSVSVFPPRPGEAGVWLL